MNMDYIKFSLGLGSFILALVTYLYELRGKKPLKIGDNQFFIENPNRISSSEYYRSWRLVILFTVVGITLISWALE